MQNSPEKTHLSSHLMIYISTSCILLLQLILFTRQETEIAHSRSMNLLVLTFLSYAFGIFHSFQRRLKKLLNTWLVNVLFLLVGWITYQVDLLKTLRFQSLFSFYAIGTKFEFMNIIRPDLITAILIVSSIILSLRLWHKHKQIKSLVNSNQFIITARSA
jgi:hypothetical protein